jgi:hypothetical protein
MKNIALLLLATLLLLVFGDFKFLDLLVKGSFIEKHNYAKNQPTKYGSLGFDAEEVLKSWGWTDRDVHRLGFKLGFSKLR